MSQDVQRMFGGIAKDYDRANTILSFGIHKAWRRAAIKAARLRRGDHCLDVATGTGDVALAVRRIVGQEGRVVGLDFARPMLTQARRKIRDKEQRVELVQGDALKLPFPDDAFHAATIAFGIRNVDEPVRGLAEMARVVKPGGRVVVLEFGQPKGIMAGPYRFYSKHVMPRVGAAITGDREAYEYLPETAARFPAGSTFESLMAETGAFQEISARALTSGVAWVYVGKVRT